MALTVVPSPPAPAAAELPRFGIWTKLSVGLMVLGLIALTSSAVIGIRWYYGLHGLTSTQRGAASVTMRTGQTHLIDENIAVSDDADDAVTVHSVSVRLSGDTSAAVVRLLSCPDGLWTEPAIPGDAACAQTSAFSTGSWTFADTRLIVSVRMTAPGTVTVAGVDVRYSEGIRSASQHLGPTVVITAR